MVFFLSSLPPSEKKKSLVIYRSFSVILYTTRIFIERRVLIAASDFFPYNLLLIMWTMFWAQYRSLLSSISIWIIFGWSGFVFSHSPTYQTQWIITHSSSKCNISTHIQAPESKRTDLVEQVDDEKNKNHGRTQQSPSHRSVQIPSFVREWWWWWCRTIKWIMDWV